MMRRKKDDQEIIDEIEEAQIEGNEDTQKKLPAREFHRRYQKKVRQKRES